MVERIVESSKRAKRKGARFHNQGEIIKETPTGADYWGSVWFWIKLDVGIVAEKALIHHSIRM